MGKYSINISAFIETFSKQIEILQNEHKFRTQDKARKLVRIIVNELEEFIYDDNIICHTSSDLTQVLNTISHWTLIALHVTVFDADKNQITHNIETGNTNIHCISFTLQNSKNTNVELCNFSIENKSKQIVQNKNVSDGPMAIPSEKDYDNIFDDFSQME